MALFALPRQHLVTHFRAGWRLVRWRPPWTLEKSWLLAWPISKQCNGVELVSASENYTILACFIVIVVSVAALITIRCR